jgi:very-short-patch-repair endonuclease
MSTPEVIVYNWLTKRNIEFKFQSVFAGGIWEFGGAVVDFVLTERMIALRVQGIYWHQGVSKKGSDDIQRETIESYGYTVVDVWEDDIENRLDETMNKAIRGEEMVRG